MNRGRSQIILIIGLLLAAFFLLDPFNILPQRRVRRPGSDPDTVEEAAQWYEREHRTPDNYLLDRFEEDQVVIVGELGRIRQQIQFMIDAVEVLPLAGVYAIGFEHVLAEDQDILDSLVDGEGDFDRKTASDLLLRADVLNGYEGYVDVLERVHRLNASREDDSQRMRVVALAPRFRYDLVETREDMNDQDILREVVGDTAPDEFMADVFEREVLEEGNKAIAFATLPHAFRGYEAPHLVEEMQQLGFDRARPFGRRVEERADGSVSTVLLHGPWPDEARPSNLNYAADGYIDSVLELVPSQMRHGGFDVDAENPLGAFPVTVGQWAEYHDELRVADLTDGYITLGPIADYRAARVIPDFYTQDTLEYARRNFPGPTEDELTTDELQQYLRGSANSFGQWLGEFQ
ncbi:MAG: hypothetical protein ACLFM0_03885 [Spirochaetales bacterium]